LVKTGNLVQPLLLADDAVISI